MKTNVIRIGNSCGIRIPKTLLAQCRMQDEVELEVVNDYLLTLRSELNRRQCPQG